MLITVTLLLWESKSNQVVFRCRKALNIWRYFVMYFWKVLHHVLRFKGKTFIRISTFVLNVYCRRDSLTHFNEAVIYFRRRIATVFLSHHTIFKIKCYEGDDIKVRGTYTLGVFHQEYSFGFSKLLLWLVLLSLLLLFHCCHYDSCNEDENYSSDTFLQFIYLQK